MKERMFAQSLAEVDPAVRDIIGFEDDRQRRKIIMIASESLCPKAVREALDSPFTNLYAEGYPSTRLSGSERKRVLEYDRYLAFHRRYGDRRFYKGTEFVNFIEVLAQKRAAEIFATDSIPAEDIQVNVQALSGAAANNAVYEAFVSPGDTVMGMSLSYGGHLSHGSPFNRSGKYYKVVPYLVNRKTGRIDYDEIRDLMKASQPKMVIGGASAYPWEIDWKKFREIVDEVAPGAMLMADISHVAGLVVAGLFPNPIGYADAVTMTTHKTLLGPRSAIILTTDPEKARRINTAVFPGEQGGPHINTIGAMAVCFKLAATEDFRAIQQRIVENAKALAEALKQRGMKLVYGGTNTHLLLVDLTKVDTESGVSLRGDFVSNILDLCGITCNKNAIPGDETGTRPGGIRLGTVIPSQLGMGPQEMEKIAELIHRVLSNIRTFQVRAITGVRLARGKIDRDVMNGIREEVAQLMDRFAGVKSGGTEGGDGILEIRGERARSFLQQVCTGNVMALETGKSMHTLLLDKEGVVLDDVVIHRAADENGFERYWLSTLPASRGKVKRWLSDLSDGFVAFDAKDVAGKIDGPVEIRDVPAGKTPSIAAKPQGRAGAQASAIFKEHPEFFQLSKPYFIGQAVLPDAKGAKAPFHYEEYKGEPRRTLLYKEHLKRTSPKFMIPFAGWSMPVWYTRASEEHAAVRNAAGLFDVSHMGRIDIKGAYAGRFVDLIASNYVPLLKDGGAHYSYIFDPEGSVMDDILVYRFAREHYFLIVNAANAEKILAWINAVADRKTALDPHCPWKEVEGRVEITDVRSEKAGDRQNVNVALQGPNAMDILLKVAADEHEKTALRDLGSFHFVTMTLGGMKAVVARTGYTGEEIGYEILVGAGDAVNFWTLLLEAGEPLGIKPCGLAARDSLRLEAGLPLYGHELAGELGLTPTEAGYGGFVKRHKTFFVGRSAYLKKESEIRREVARFQLNSRQARMVHPGDAVVEKEGKRIGVVTSCTLIDKVQSGLACLDLGYKKNGGALAVLVASKGGKEGEREELVILPRFPMRKKRNARPAKPSNGSK